MSQLRREVGFWPSLGRMRLGRLVSSPEFLGAAIVGGWGGSWLLNEVTVTERVAIAGDILVLLGPLAGIVFAAFALVVSFLSSDYLKWLRAAPDGLRGFLAPFIVAIGMQVGALIASIAYRASAETISRGVERKFFVALCIVVIFSALDVVALARNVFAHGVTRARGLEVEDLAARRRGRSESG